MRKKLSFLRYFMIFAATVLIFILGILIGGDVEQMRVQSLYTQLQEQDLDYQNVLTESNYIDFLVSSKEINNNVSCDLIQGAYYTSIINLDNSREKLESYINVAKVREEEYERLKSHYSNLQINYWVLAKKINSLCDKSMNSILYFYGDKKKCPACEDQGIHLSYVKSKLKDEVLIFSFESESEGVVQILSQRYDVNLRELPVLVINNEIHGFLKNQEIIEVLCSTEYNDSQVC
jgi:hypothetical protein